MAVFEIELSNGQAYEVEGPDNATPEQLMGEVAKQVDPTELRILQTKNDDFGNFLRTQAQQPREGESDEARDIRLGGQITGPEIGTTEGMIRAGQQGLTFGFGDELTGAVGAGLEQLQGSDRTFSEAFDARTDRERQKLKQFRQQSPVAAFGTEVAGAIPTAIATAPASLPGGLLMRMLQGAGVGAGQGAVFGAGTGEGGVKNRLSNALVPAAFGGALGAAAPAVAAGARPLIDRFRGPAQQARQAGMSTPAFNELSGMAQAAGQRGVQRLASVGDDAMLADAGPTMSGVTDMLARRPGASAGIIQDAVEGRVNQAGQRLGGTLDDVLGAPQGLRATARDIAQQSAPARQEAYDIAYNQFVNYADEPGQKVLSVLDRVPDSIKGDALQQASDLMQVDGLGKQILVETTESGVDFIKQPNVVQLDYIKRALGAIGEEVNTLGRPSPRATLARTLGRDLRDAVGDAVPGYREALKLGGDNITTQNALELGSNLLRPGTTREIVNEFVERARVDGELPVDVLDAFRAGIRSQISEAMDNVRAIASDPNIDAREVRKLVSDISSKAARQKVETVLGVDEASRLFNEVDRAVTALNLRAATSMRSPTAPRASIEGRLTEPTIANQALNLRPGAIREAGAVALGGGKQAQQQVLDARLAEMAQALTGPRGAQAQQLLQELQLGQASVERVGEIRNLIQQLIISGAGAQAPLSTQLSQ